MAAWCRFGASSHWRGFAQQAGAEQEGAASSKPSAEKAEKAEKAEAEAGAAEADAKEASGEADTKDSKKTEEATSAEKDASAEEAAETKELSPMERLQAELDELQEKSKQKKRELLLALADFENNKKKLTKERENRRRAASANFARRMVDVYTEFDELPSLRASSAGKEEGSPYLALQEGVALTRDLFAAALEKSDVERLVAEPGVPVVAARHEVVGTVAGDGSFPEKSIGEVVEAGWILDLRSPNPQVLRKAKVKTVE